MVPVVWMVLLVLLVLLSLLLLLVLLAVPIVLRFYPIHRYRYLRATTRPWGQSHRRTTTKSGPQQKVTISWPSTSCCAFSCRILPSHCGTTVSTQLSRHNCCSRQPFWQTPFYPALRQLLILFGAIFFEFSMLVSFRNSHSSGVSFWRGPLLTLSSPVLHA